MNEYDIELAWFQLDGAPYPVQGYRDLKQAGPLFPWCDRDNADLTVELINRGYPYPMLEWEAHQSGDPEMGGYAATEEGEDEGFRSIYVNLSVANMKLYPMTGLNWTLAEPPDEKMWHLEFKSREQPDFLAYGSGTTLFQALASLERDLMAQCSEDAAFHNHCCFLRDITSIDVELGGIGGLFSCYDFSCPEDAFEIRRIPFNPRELVIVKPSQEQSDTLEESLKRMDKALHELATNMGLPLKKP